MRRHHHRVGAAAAGLVIALGLTACSGEADEEEPTAAETSEVEETEEEPVAVEGQPAWANPIAEGGEVFATIELGDVTVEARQMGTETATRTGNFVDPEDNEPIISEGDEIVYVQYVVTNTGDPIDLGSSLVSFDARYDDWPYLQGMDGTTDLEQYESLGLFTSGVAAGEAADPPVYTLGTGESFSVSENFLYQAGSPLTIEATMTPVDAEGNLLHDDRVEGEGSGTIS